MPLLLEGYPRTFCVREAGVDLWTLSAGAMHTYRSHSILYPIDSQYGEHVTLRECSLPRPILRIKQTLWWNSLANRQCFKALRAGAGAPSYARSRPYGHKHRPCSLTFRGVMANHIAFTVCTLPRYCHLQPTYLPTSVCIYSKYRFGWGLFTIIPHTFRFCSIRTFPFITRTMPVARVLKD